MKQTSHERAVPVWRMESPIRPGCVLEFFEDAEAVWREKEYLKYQDVTPAERIRHGEELRRMAYGERYAAARLQGPVEGLERA